MDEVFEGKGSGGTKILNSAASKTLPDRVRINYAELLAAIGPLLKSVKQS